MQGEVTFWHIQCPRHIESVDSVTLNIIGSKKFRMDVTEIFEKIDMRPCIIMIGDILKG